MPIFYIKHQASASRGVSTVIDDQEQPRYLAFTHSPATYSVKFAKSQLAPHLTLTFSKTMNGLVNSKRSGASGMSLSMSNNLIG